MKYKTWIIMIFLVIGLLGVPNCIFAQQYQSSSSDTLLNADLPALMDSNSVVPQLKGGGRSGGSSISKTVKKADVDDDGVSGDDGGSWWIILIVIVIIAIIAILVWYFFLR